MIESWGTGTVGRMVEKLYSNTSFKNTISDI